MPRKYKPDDRTKKVYTERYNTLKVKSVISNPSARQSSLSHSSCLDGKKQIAVTLKEWKEKLPSKEEALAKVENDYKKYCQSKLNQGFPLPKQMPMELDERKQYLEAEEDVIKDEIVLLQKKLSEALEKDPEYEFACFCRGLQFGGPLWHGLRRTIDHQLCALLTKGGQLYSVEEYASKNDVTVLNMTGILIISDARSKYDGMAVADYYQVTRQWQEEKSRVEAERAEANKKKHLETGEETFKINYFPPLPDWPEGVKNHKKK